MRHLGLIFAVAAALSLGAVGAALAGTPSSAVQASGSSMRSASRGSVKAGKLRLEFVNYGEDDHDLAIRRIGTDKTTYLPEVRPGEKSVKRMRVKKGSYKLWCTISDHESRGMRATLKVKKAN